MAADNTNSIFHIGLAELVMVMIFAFRFDYPVDEFWWWIDLRGSKIKRDVSCGGPNDRNVKSIDHNDDIWMAWHRCAFDSDASIHRCVQIAIRNLPTSIYMAFHLWERNEKKKSRKLLVSQN